MILVLVLTLGACAGTLPGGPRRVLYHADRVLLGADVISLACDWGSTRRAAVDHWSYGHEVNAMLGSTPSVGRVDQYMAVAMVGTIALGLLLPDYLGAPFLSAVTAIEVDSVAFNYGTVPGVCGLPADPTTTALR